MQDGRGIRGDYFVDRLGGCTEALLALAGLGITISRFKHGILPADETLALLFIVEFVGAVAITWSRLAFMRFAFRLFVFRVAAGFVYLSIVHGDRLAADTLGFPLVVAIYCWVRVRALARTP